MAQESCNRDEDEAEILKPSSPSPPNPSPSQHPTTTVSNPSTSTSSSSSPTPSPPLCIKPPQEFSTQEPQSPKESCRLKAEKERQPSVQFANRCSSCKKKVGLTGFRCRCGDLLCVKHRYSDTHDCSFDYKAFGREEISKANPLIRATKIIKI